MNRLSGRTVRVRGARVPVLLGWLLVLLSVASCCSPASARSDGTHHETVPLSALRSFTPVAAVAARVVVADAPQDRGSGSSCHVAPDDATPVLLPSPPAPAALPCATAVPPAGCPAGAAGIRGPTNDAVGDVDHLTLQVQRI